MFEKHVSIRGRQLDSYSFSSGGGMTGGYRRKTVKRCEDHALISFESAKWYAQDPEVAEFRTDTAVLDELEAVVRKYKMNFWNRKTFTREFVCDGESISYSFGFGDADISFSSQIYPGRYREKLAQLDAVIDRYIANEEKLPGLVIAKDEDEEEEEEGRRPIPEGKQVIYVFSYAQGSIALRILNGTEEEIEIPDKYKLINADTGAVLAEEKTPYGGRFSERSRDEMYIRLKNRLDVGNYKLIFGTREILFAIA